MNRSRRVLIVGSDGQIGSALSRQFAVSGHEVFETTRRLEGLSEHRLHLDLASDISGWVPPEDCSIAILCAAITNQETCRKNPDVTRRINVDQTVAIARRLVDAGTRIIFLSTNLVFDGEKPLVKADAEKNPRTEYGRQKSEAESALMKLGDLVSIMRLSKVFTATMPLLHKWVEALRKKEVIAPLTDLRCSPIPLDFVVSAIQQFAVSSKTGIFQISGEQDVSYAEIAHRLALLLHAEDKLVTPRSSVELGLQLEHLPKNTTIDMNRLITDFALTPPPVSQTLDDVLAKVIARA